MRILIVEDNPSVRRMMVSFLSRVADDIKECADGGEALAAYSKWKPDWVLMDIKMGEVDGLTATRQIKAQFPDAKIIIVTNHDDEDLKQAAGEAGAYAYVLKQNLLDLKGLLRQA
ncbi:MAG TPA: response regulator transcription factor [Blastocatellia bacterium]